MSYTLKLGSFKKHENSTAQPTTTGWTSYNVTLKGGADIDAPVVEVYDSYNNIKNYDYATMFSKYYFVRKKSMIREKLCELQLELDPMATYKSEIGSTSMYILRAANASDGSIVDNYYPSTGKVTHSWVSDSNFYPVSYSSGCYIVNVVGTATSGNSTLWKLTPANFRALISALYTSIDGFQPQDVEEALSKLIGGSPEKLVSSAMFLPNFGFGVEAAEEIVIGTWHSGVYGNLINDPVYEDVSWINMTLPKHPQAAARGSFLNLSPYSTYTLSIPLFGVVNIDTTAVINSTSINAAFSLDAITGQGKCRITASGTDGPIIADLTAQIGASVPLQGQSSGASIAGGITSTLAGVAAAIASGGAAAPIIGAVSSGIGTAVTALKGASFSSGSAGGILAARLTPALNATFLSITDEDNANNGRPYCKVATPSTLTGYMLVYKSLVEISGTITQQEKIDRILESGFYYE